MSVGRSGIVAASLLLVAMNLSCARYYENFLHTATVEKIDERKLSPAERRAALRGCIAANSMFASADFTKEISQGEAVRMAHHAASCYEALVRDVGADRTMSADERAAIALAAERSVLAVDPDPQTRLQWAARIAEVAAAALKEKGDPGAVDASLRAAWYASRAGADDVEETSSKLWREVRAADEEFFAQRAAEEASRRAMIAQIGSAVQSAAIANASPAQRQQLQQQQQIQRMVTDAALRIVQVSRQLAESRADLRVLLDAGVRALPDMMPEIDKHVASFRDWAAAGDLVVTIDGVRRKEPGAKERLFVRLAKSFGADVEVDAPPPTPPPPSSAASAEPPPPTPKTAAQRLGELKDLLDKGLIQQSEFDEQKKRILEEVVQ